MADPLLERIKKSSGSEYFGIKKCALAYSGGLDSSAMALILQDLGIEAITVSLDLGQGLEKAKKFAPLISKKNYFFDAQDDLVSHIKKGVWANTLHHGHINSEGMSRPLIAKYLVQAAEKEGCEAVVHGSSGTGNDQFRMENGIRVLAPHLRIIAPIRDWNLSREEAVSYVKKKKLPIKTDGGSPFSVDENLWCRAIRYGAISQSASFHVPPEAYAWTCGQDKCALKPEKITLFFEDGFPKKMTVSGSKKEFSGVSLFTELNRLAGKNGIGRINKVEDKIIGLKSHEVFECPAAAAITLAHRNLESLTLTSSELEMKNSIDASWARLVYNGGWYTRLRHSLEGFISHTQGAVDGTVELSLYKGGIELLGMSSPHELYDSRMSSRGQKSAFDQRDSRGFAKLYGLQDIVAYRLGNE